MVTFKDLRMSFVWTYWISGIICCILIGFRARKFATLQRLAVASRSGTPFIVCPCLNATQGTGWLTWFSQSLALTQPSVWVVILIASTPWGGGETSCPSRLHYAASHCVPLLCGSRLLHYQNDDASHKCQPEFNSVPLQAQSMHECTMWTGSAGGSMDARFTKCWFYVKKTKEKTEKWKQLFRGQILGIFLSCTSSQFTSQHLRGQMI